MLIKKIKTKLSFLLVLTCLNLPLPHQKKQIILIIFDHFYFNIQIVTIKYDFIVHKYVSIFTLTLKFDNLFLK